MTFARPAAAAATLALVVYAAAGPGFDVLVNRPLAVAGLLLVGLGLCRRAGEAEGRPARVHAKA